MATWIRPLPRRCTDLAAVTCGFETTFERVPS